MDLEQEEQKARREFLADQERATYQGQPPSDDRLQGSAEGWDAAVLFLKRAAFRKLLGD